MSWGVRALESSERTHRAQTNTTHGLDMYIIRFRFIVHDSVTCTVFCLCTFSMHYTSQDPAHRVVDVKLSK